MSWKHKGSWKFDRDQGTAKFSYSRELKMNSKMKILEMDISVLAGCW